MPPPARFASTASPPPPSQPAASLNDEERKKADMERLRIITERDEALRKLAHLEKEKDQWSADKKSLSAQLDERDRQLIEVRESAKSAAMRLGDAEKQNVDLKSAVDAAKVRQLAMTEEYNNLQKELTATATDKESSSGLMQQLAVLEKAKADLSATISNLTSQASDRERQLNEAREQANSAETKIADVVKQNLDLKSAVETAKSQQLAMAEEHGKLRNEISATRDQLSTATADKERVSGLQQQLAVLEKTKTELSASITSLTAQVRDREQQLNAAKESAAKTDARVADLEKERIERKQLQEQMSALAAENKKIAAEKNALTLEINTLKSEHAVLIKQLQETKALAASMEGMRSQIADLQAQEKQLEQVIAQSETKKAPAPIPVSAPAAETLVLQPTGERWKMPANDLPRKLARLAAIEIAVVVVGLLGWWLWPKSIQPPMIGEPGSAGKQAIAFSRQDVDVAFNTPVDSDGMEITFTGARIAPVTLVTISGRETTTEQRYLIIDVHLVNRTSDKSVSLFRPWQETRLLDSNKQALRQAFREAMPLGEEIKGAANGRELTAGSEINDMIIFEWNNEPSPEFTMKGSPTFWVRTAKDNLVPTSNLSISLKIPAESITGR